MENQIEKEEKELIAQGDHLLRLRRVAGRSIWVVMGPIFLNAVIGFHPAIRPYRFLTTGISFVLFLLLAAFIFTIQSAQLKLDHIRTINHHLEKESANHGAKRILP